MKVLNDIVFKWLRHRKRVQDLNNKSDALLRALKDTDRTTRAMVLAMSAVYRFRVIDRSAQLSKALNYSGKMSKERIGLIFELLQAIQVKTQQEKNALDQKLEALEVKENTQITHWRKSQLGMDLWMITIGTGYTPKIKEKTIKIWSLLDESASELSQAFNQLKQLQNTVNELSPTPTVMFGDITDSQWQALCSYRPAFFDPK